MIFSCLVPNLALLPLHGLQAYNACKCAIMAYTFLGTVYTAHFSHKLKHVLHVQGPTRVGQLLFHALRSYARRYSVFRLWAYKRAGRSIAMSFCEGKRKKNITQPLLFYNVYRRKRWIQFRDTMYILYTLYFMSLNATVVRCFTCILADGNAAHCLGFFIPLHPTRIYYDTVHTRNGPKRFKIPFIKIYNVLRYTLA